MTLYLNESYHSRAANFVSVFTLSGKEEFVYVHKERADCQLPAFITKHKELVTSGLCHVSRQLIKHAVSLTQDEQEKKLLESLLGYKKNSLKASAVVSNWTRFCEAELPSATEKLIADIATQSDRIAIPNAFIRLEKEFSVPKKTPNALKYFQGSKKDLLKSRDNVVVEVVPCQSIDTIWCKCGFSSPSKDGNPPSDMKIESNPDNQSVGSEKDIVWHFLSGLTFTVADLLILACFMEIFSKVSSLNTLKSLFTKLPKTHQWILNCFSNEKLFSSVKKIWNCSKKLNEFITEFIAPTDDSIKPISYTEKTGSTKQTHSRITKALPGILKTLEDNSLTCETFGHQNDNKVISWSSLPKQVDPSGGELKERSKRKREQLENMVSQILPLVHSGDTIVEFCAGGGHLGIVLAYLRPDCHVVLLDNKEESMVRACSRIKQIGLSNVTFYLMNLEYYTDSFHLATTLHACGTATDLVLKKCLGSRSNFVVCPCCYGGIQSTTDVVYPRSRKFNCLSTEQYNLLAHSADQTCNDQESEYNKQGKRSMLLVDLDRKLQLIESGHYDKIDILTMEPKTCSPKNNIIVGIPSLS